MLGPRQPLGSGEVVVTRIAGSAGEVLWVRHRSGSLTYIVDFDPGAPEAGIISTLIETAKAQPGQVSFPRSQCGAESGLEPLFGASLYSTGL